MSSIGRTKRHGPQECRARVRRWMGGASRDTQSGASTLEFAMVGGTYFMLLLSVLLFGVYYLRTTILDLAVTQASRNVMTGQSTSSSQFVADIQAASYGMLSGQTIYAAVQSAGSFGAITPVANIATGGSGGLPFNPGGFGADVLIQVGYQDHLLAAILPQYIANVVTTAAFQNEPAPQ